MYTFDEVKQCIESGVNDFANEFFSEMDSARRFLVKLSIMGAIANQLDDLKKEEK